MRRQFVAKLFLFFAGRHIGTRNLCPRCDDSASLITCDDFASVNRRQRIGKDCRGLDYVLRSQDAHGHESRPAAEWVGVRLPPRDTGQQPAGSNK